MPNVFCSKCGQQMSDTATACPSCGSLRSAASSASAPLAHTFAEPGALGFFKTLLDTSFSNFITLKLIKYAYILGGIAITIAAVIFGFSGFSTRYGALLSWEGSFWRGLLTLFIGAPIFWVVWIVSLRVMLEFISAVFRIAESTSTTVKVLENR